MGSNPRTARSGRSGRRVSVLVVDDEAVVLGRIRRWLEQGSMDAFCVQTAVEAMRVASDSRLDIALVDYRLDATTDGVRLGGSLRRDFGVPFILISGFLDTTVTVQAMRAGALDVVDKPLDPERLLSAVDRALAVHVDNGPSVGNRVAPPAAVSPCEPRSTALKWARMLLEVCGADGDPRTMPLWGQMINTSPGTIRETCRVCGVRPHDARDLARFLRALSRNRSASVPLRTYFNVADERTLDHLFDRAGIPRDVRTMTLPAFLLAQGFVRTSSPCLQELGHLAANSPFFD
jgi:CheY-like chemotaxis protein